MWEELVAVGKAEWKHCTWIHDRAGDSQWTVSRSCLHHWSYSDWAEVQSSHKGFGAALNDFWHLTMNFCPMLGIQWNQFWLQMCTSLHAGSEYWGAFEIRPAIQIQMLLIIYLYRWLEPNPQAGGGGGKRSVIVCVSKPGPKFCSLKSSLILISDRGSCVVWHFTVQRNLRSIFRSLSQTSIFLKPQDYIFQNLLSLINIVMMKISHLARLYFPFIVIQKCNVCYWMLKWEVLLQEQAY